MAMASVIRNITIDKVFNYEIIPQYLISDSNGPIPAHLWLEKTLCQIQTGFHLYTYTVRLAFEVCRYLVSCVHQATLKLSILRII